MSRHTTRLLARLASVACFWRRWGDVEWLWAAAFVAAAAVALLVFSTFGLAAALVTITQVLLS